MALSANADYIIKPVRVTRPISMIVLNAAVIYKGAFCTHDTVAGEIKPYDGTATDRAVGWADDGPVTGNSSGVRNRVSIWPGGIIIRNIPVTGVANTAADYGDLVYMSDDGTFTLTSSSNKLVGKGIADDKRDTGNLNVYLFPIEDGVIDSAAT